MKEREKHNLNDCIFDFEINDLLLRLRTERYNHKLDYVVRVQFLTGDYLPY